MPTEKHLHVSVATASVIIASQSNPYRILVGYSRKHAKPVIPGGKIEKEDMTGDLQEAGIICVLRETEEEIGTSLQNPRYIGEAVDAKRDVRTVPYSKIKTAIIVPALPENTPETAQIRASYGCPDFIYTGSIDESSLIPTEELSGLRFIDSRSLQVGDLSAGHDVVVLLYRQMLDEGQSLLPTDSMRDFEYDRQQLISMRRGSGPSANKHDALKK